jgi:hypothetical protein
MVDPWCSVADVQQRLGSNAADHTALSLDRIAAYARMATDALYVLSGRQYKAVTDRVVTAQAGRPRPDNTAWVMLGAWWPVNTVDDVTPLAPDGSGVPLEPSQWAWSGGVTVRIPSSYARWTVRMTIGYGQPPTPSAVLAATALAVELALNDPDYDGDSQTRLPALTTSISRQGVSQSFSTILDVLKEGSTGIYEVDQFIRTVNPTRSTSRPRVRTMS